MQGTIRLRQRDGFSLRIFERNTRNYIFSGTRERGEYNYMQYETPSRGDAGTRNAIYAKRKRVLWTLQHVWQFVFLYKQRDIYFRINNVELNDGEVMVNLFSLF